MIITKRMVMSWVGTLKGIRPSGGVVERFDYLEAVEMASNLRIARAGGDGCRRVQDGEKFNRVFGKP